MNQRKITKSLIIAVVIGLLTFGAQAAENLLAANYQSFMDVPDDAEVNQQLAEVRRATAKYHDINVAIEDGFAIFGGNGECEADEEETNGIIYTNLSRVRQQGVIAEEPELLFYFPTGDGNLRLAAVGYFNRALYIDTRGIIPGTFPSRLDPLPPYFEEVSGPFQLFNQPSTGPDIEPGLPWFYGMRVWIWSPNPEGMFALHNPRLNCTANS